MNCTSCKKPLKEGATKCACGAAAPSNFSYDLLPEEPEKKEEGGPGQQYQLPPGAILPPGMSVPAPTAPGEEKPARVLRADRNRGGSSMKTGNSSLKTMGIGAAVVLIFILLIMKMCGGSSKTITGPGAKLDSTVTVFVTMPVTRNFEIVGKGEYNVTLEAKTGDLLFGVQMRSPKDRVTAELIKSWNLTPVKKGETKTLSGDLGTGTYSFVVSTDSKIGITGQLKGSVK